MNRRIKFRVWDIKFSQWIEWASSVHNSCVGINEIFEQDKYYIFQQFTGFKDINDKEIYEGDFVNFTIPGIAHGPERENVKRAEVHWSEEDGCWYFGKYHADGLGYWDGHSIVGDRIDTESFEIVGNIFEK